MYVDPKDSKINNNVHSWILAQGKVNQIYSQKPLLQIMKQCSPYQAVTGKIYRLKQHFLPPATAWRFTKIKEVVLKNM